MVPMRHASIAPHGGPGSSPRDDLAVGVRCRTRYVIASIQRSGSSLLAWALWSTGRAGAPNEYLNPLHRRHFDTRWGPLTLPTFLEQLERHRTSANGVFGLKIHNLHRLRWVDSLSHDLAALVPGARWIAITRRDHLAQAVSFEIARQTRRWSSAQPASPQEPIYSAAAIDRRLDQIVKAESGWERFFYLNHITPLRLTYEVLVADLSATVEQVLDHLGVERGAEATSRRGMPERQANDLNEQWIDRYRKGD